MKKTLVMIALLASACANPTEGRTRFSSCGEIRSAFDAAEREGRFPGGCTVLCPWFTDDVFQSSCWPVEEGCERPCDPVGVEVCEAAVRAAESCEGFHAAMAASCGVEVCGG
jgi:hypothetical protein